MNDVETAVAYLRSPLAIRARCENILEAGLAGRLQHVAIELHALPKVVDEVVAVTVAARLREGGGSPIRIASDGTVF